MENVHSIPVVSQPTLERGPITQRPEEVSDTQKLKVDEDIPVSLYKGRMGKSFTTQLFPEISAFDRETMNKLDVIEEYVLSDMSSKGLADSKKTYAQHLTKLMDALGIDKNSRAEIKVGKLHSAISMMRLGMLKPDGIASLLKFANGN